MSDNPGEVVFFDDSDNADQDQVIVENDTDDYQSGEENDFNIEDGEIDYGEEDGEELDEYDEYSDYDDYEDIGPLPEIHCAYCNNDDPTALALCSTCSKWFCNSACKFGSHIYQHLVESGHKGILLHPEGLQRELSDAPICCFNNNQHTNVFELGTIRNEDGYVTFICRNQCLNKTRLKEIGWDGDSFSHIIKDRQFVNFLLNTESSKSRFTIPISLNEIRDLEHMWKTNADATLNDVRQSQMDDKMEFDSIPNRFESASEYNEIFTPLISSERASDKLDCESKHIDNVMLRWENGINNKKIAIFHNNTYDARYRMTTGQKISFHLPLGYSNKPEEECVYQGEIIHTQDNEIHVQMDDNDVPLGQTSGYYITFSWTPVSFDRMEGAVKAMYDKECMSLTLYNQILGLPTTSVVFPLLAPHSISIPNFTELNESQILAVKAALQNELTLIQGPPGTGKTVTSATIVYHLVRSYHQRVLVCAPSNIAVDNLASRISQLGLRVVRVVSRSRESVSSDISDLCLHNIACYVGGENGELYKLHQQYTQTGQLPNDKIKRYKTRLREAERMVLKSAEVVCCTCVTSRDERIASIDFPNVLIDESTQAREPECLIPIVNGCKRLIMVGDHQQLGPVVLNSDVKRAGFDRSMFERLLSLNIKPYRLKVQYRMHPALSEFSSNVFYNGELQNGIHTVNRTRKINFPWPRTDKPMMFWTVNGTEDPGSSGRSLQNRDEANCVVAAVTRLLECNIPGDRIGIITPYDSQRSLILQLLNRHANKETTKIDVCSVDEFQGREKDYIIFSCVRSNSHYQIGFLKDTRRLNVALTRAKYGLIIVGNPTTLKGDELWLSLIIHFQNNKCLVCGSTLDNLSLYAITFEQKKQIQSRRQYALGEELRKNEMASGDDSSYFLGLGMEIDSLLAKLNDTKVDVPLANTILEDTGL